MKIIYSLLVSCFLLSTTNIYSQVCNDYPCVIKKVKNAISAKNYRFAFEQLESAANYPDENDQEITDLRKEIFNGMDRQKEEAINAKEEAKRQAKNAEKGKKEAIASKLASSAREVLATDNDAIVALRLAEAATKVSSPPSRDVIKCLHDICSNSFEVHRIVRLIKRNAHQEQFVNVTFSKNGELFASCHNPKNQVVVNQSGKSSGDIRIWETKAGKNFRTIKTDTLFFNDFNFSQNGEYFALRYVDNTIKVWQLGKEQPITIFKDTIQNNTFKSIFFKKNKPLLFARTNNQVQIIDISSKRILKSYKGISKIKFISPSDDGKRIVVAHENKANNGIAISFINIENNKVSFFKDLTNYNLNTLAISPNKKLIALSKQNVIEVWDLVSKTKIKEFTYASQPIFLLRFSEDSRYLVSSQTQHGRAKLWDLKLFENIQTFNTNSHPYVQAITISSDNRYVLQYCGDNTVKIWRTPFDLLDPEKNATLNEEEKTFFGVPSTLKDK